MTVVWLLLLVVTLASSSSVINEFNAWFDSHDGVRVLRAGASARYGGNGVIPRRGGAKGDVLIKWPLSLALHRRSLSALGNTLLDAAAKSRLLDDSDLIALAIVLIRNRVTGFEHWFAWSELLPRDFASPMMFVADDAQAVALLDADMLKSVQEQRKAAESHFATVLELAERHAVAGALRELPLTLANWLWALGMVNSRAWALRGTRYLLPMADMFNFAPTQAQLSRDHTYSMAGEEFATTHKVVGDELHVVADRDYVAGEELFETYGDNSNTVYFMYHGFVPDVNPAACVELPVTSRANEASNAFKLKQQIMTTLRVPRHRTYCARDKQFMPIDAKDKFPIFPQWLSDVVNIDKLGAADAKSIVKDPRYIWRIPDLAESNSKLVQTALHRWSVGVRDAFATTLDDDEAALKAEPGTLSAAARLTRQYVRAQKRILSQWIMPDPPEVAEFKNRQKAKQKQAAAAAKDEL